MTVPSLLPAVFAGFVGLALSAQSGFDWGTDDDDDYESPFTDEDDPSGNDESDPSGDEHPFAGVADDEPKPDASRANKPTPQVDDPLSTTADAQALCDEAMNFLHDGDPAGAFERLETQWAFSSDEMTQLQREVERTRAVVADRYGDALDYRLVREDAVDEVLVRFVYVERFTLHGLRWRFTFYRGPDGWALNDVYFDDEIEALLG